MLPYFWNAGFKKNMIEFYMRHANRKPSRAEYVDQGNDRYNYGNKRKLVAKRFLFCLIIHVSLSLLVRSIKKEKTENRFPSLLLNCTIASCSVERKKEK